MIKDPIIEKPEAVSPTQRFTQGAVTVTFWLGFGFLLRPVFTLAGWVIGALFFSREMLVEDGLQDWVRLLGWFLLAILIMTVTLKTWAWYNYRFFGNRNMRRTFPPPVSLEEIASINQIDPDELLLWQNARRLVIRHDAQGRILHVSHGNFQQSLGNTGISSVPSEVRWQSNVPPA